MFKNGQSMVVAKQKSQAHRVVLVVIFNKVDLTNAQRIQC